MPKPSQEQTQLDRNSDSDHESNSSLEPLEDSIPGLRAALRELASVFPEMRSDAIRAALGLPGEARPQSEISIDTYQKEKRK